MQERLADDDHVNAVAEAIKSLDLTPLHDAYRGCGSDPYAPELMLGIALVEILDKRCSPTQWSDSAKRKEQCKFLGRGIEPARGTWYRFRDRCGSFIREVFDQIVRGGIEEELILPVTASLDGTFTRSHATRHRIVNFDQLTKRIEKLDRAIDLLDGPRPKPLCDPSEVETDAAETIPAWIAATPLGRQLQRRQYGKAEETFQKRFIENANRPKKYRKAEATFTLSVWDCDAVIGRDKEKVICPLYNSQFMVDCSSGVTLTYEVFPQCTDSGTLIPMIELTREVIGADILKQVLADSGYCSLLDIQDCEAHEIDLLAPVQDSTGTSFRKAANGQPQLPQNRFDFGVDGQSCMCPQGHAMRQRARGVKPRADGRSVIEVRWEQSEETCAGCPLKPECLQSGSKRRSVARLEGQEKLDAQAAKMNSDVGKQAQRTRATTVERAFGDCKENRGFRRHHSRSLPRAKAEIGLVVVAQNILRLYNLRKAKEKRIP